jgi:hypothetical protein
MQKLDWKSENVFKTYHLTTEKLWAIRKPEWLHWTSICITHLIFWDYLMKDLFSNNLVPVSTLQGKSKPDAWLPDHYKSRLTSLHLGQRSKTGLVWYLLHKNWFIYSFQSKGYSQHPKTEPLGFWTVIFRTLFESGYRMVRFSDARSYMIGPCFEWSTSLNRFINQRVIKNILIMTKWSSLYIRKPSSFWMAKTKWLPKHSKIRKPDKSVWTTKYH